MEEKNELSDILLTKNTGSSSNKKILLAVATLAIVLIVVVVIMNRINATGTENLPQAVLPPDPVETQSAIADDPLFEPVEVIEEDASVSEEDDKLDKIAQKLKQQSLDEEKLDFPEAEVVVVDEPSVAPVKKKIPVKKTKTTKAKPVHKKAVSHGKYYVQVGSFTRFVPDKKFLAKIKKSGYQYTIMTKNKREKVLVGPFNSKAEARQALPGIKKRIEKGAFIVKG